MNVRDPLLAEDREALLPAPIPPQDADYDGGDVPIYAAAPTRDGGTPTARG